MSAKPKFEFDAMMSMMSMMINGSMFQCFKVNVIYFSTEVILMFQVNVYKVFKAPETLYGNQNDTI